MPRVQLFEFGDQRWFPRVLRDAETAYLATAYRICPPLLRQWAEKIATVLPRGETAEILDLCSGAGGALPPITEQLLEWGYDVRASLSDLYPNPSAVAHSRISWIREPVDATHVPFKLATVRTMFSSFHHFRPPAAQAILRDAFERRCAICIFESGQGTLVGVLTAVVVPLAVLALMPLARPFRWSYLVFTYLIPLTPLVIFWDGIVSMLRIYSPKQMRVLTGELKASDYAWEIGRIKVRGIPGKLPYLIGRPV